MGLKGFCNKGPENSGRPGGITGDFQDWSSSRWTRAGGRSSRPPSMPFNTGHGLTDGFPAHRQAIAPWAPAAAEFQFGWLVFHHPLPLASDPISY